MERPIYSIDWLSRVMAAGSLIASGAAAAFLYSYTQSELPPADVNAAVKSVLTSTDGDTLLDEKVEAAVAKATAEHNDRIKTALARVNHDAELMLRGWQKESQDQRNEIASKFNSVLIQLNSELMAGPVQPIETDSGDAPNETADVTNEDGIAKSVDPTAIVRQDAKTDAFLDDPSPELRFVSVQLRPNLGNASSILRVFNEGDAAARVEEVAFEPKRVFDLDESALQSIRSSDSTKTMYFKPADNRATETGKHHTYVRKLAKPLVIDPNKDVMLRIEIWDSEHFGFGFHGNVVLTYDDGRKITEQARVIFRKSDGS